jgi:hypothetical protein
MGKNPYNLRFNLRNYTQIYSHLTPNDTGYSVGPSGKGKGIMTVTDTQKVSHLFPTLEQYTSPKTYKYTEVGMIIEIDDYTYYKVLDTCIDYETGEKKLIILYVQYTVKPEDVGYFVNALNGTLYYRIIDRTKATHTYAIEDQQNAFDDCPKIITVGYHSHKWTMGYAQFETMCQRNNRAYKQDWVCQSNST